MVVDKEPTKTPSAEESNNDNHAFEEYLEEYDSLNRDMDQLSGFLDRLERSTLDVQQRARELLNLTKVVIEDATASATTSKNASTSKDSSQS